MADTHEHVHNEHSDSGGNANFMLGIVVLIVFIFLLFYFGVLAPRGSNTPQNSVPEQIDINTNPQ